MSDWGISAYYDSSFGAADFWTQSPAPIPSDEEAIAEYHHPGSDNNTVILLGQTTRRLDLRVACNASDYSTLRSLRGSSGTLEYPGQSSITARLIKITGNVHPGFDGIYDLTLSFLI